MSLAEGVAKKSQCRGVVARTERPERSQKHKKRKAMCISFSVACPPADRTFLFWGESCAKKVSPSATTNKNTASEGSNKKTWKRTNKQKLPEVMTVSDARQCRFARTHTQKKKKNKRPHTQKPGQTGKQQQDTPFFP